jgi:hypothetical protein
MNNMKLEMHENLQRVAEFMQEHIPAQDRCGVAKAIAIIAPALWADLPASDIQPLKLYEPEIEPNNSI